MYVINSILIINNILTNYFNCDIYSVFLDGYCLEYFDMLKKLYPGAIMVIHKTKNHVAALINGNIYDVSGIRNKDEFEIANKIEEDYIRSFYNKFSNFDKENIYELLNKNNKTILKKHK